MTPFGARTSSGGTRHGLIAHGTLYKALARLQDAGLLDAVWEQPEVAERAGRPRRKLYEVTTAGEAALQAVKQPATAMPRIAVRPSTT